ncbi:hypothetical protein SALBM135S_05125 [Streptomyces alboniger]
MFGAQVIRVETCGVSLLEPLAHGSRNAWTFAPVSMDFPVVVGVGGCLGHRGCFARTSPSGVFPLLTVGLLVRAGAVGRGRYGVLSVPLRRGLRSRLPCDPGAGPRRYVRPRYRLRGPLAAPDPRSRAYRAPGGHTDTSPPVVTAPAGRHHRARYRPLPSRRIAPAGRRRQMPYLQASSPSDCACGPSSPGAIPASPGLSPPAGTRPRTAVAGCHTYKPPPTDRTCGPSPPGAIPASPLPPEHARGPPSPDAIPT